MSCKVLRRKVALWSSRSDQSNEQQSREFVTRGQLVLLEGFLFAFHAKNWGLAGLATGVSAYLCKSLTWIEECIDTTPTKTIERVCVSPASKKQICLLCTKVITNKDFKQRLTISGGRKRPKLVWILKWSPERRYPVAKVHFWQTFCTEIAQTKTKP